MRLYLAFLAIALAACATAPRRTPTTAEYARLRSDWAELSLYADSNARLGPPRTGEHRVVFMGNSITQSWAVLDSGFFAGRPYIDRGISGQTTPQMLVRFRQDVIDLGPSAVVILAGVNDIAGNTGPTTVGAIYGNIVSMIELARASGIAVVLCSLLPANRIPWRLELQPARDVQALNAMLGSYASAHGVVFVDYYGAMVDSDGGLRPELTRDGVHPTLAGFRVMEPLVERGIAEALASRDGMRVRERRRRGDP